MSAVLGLEAVAIEVGGQRLLSDVGFEVAPGEVVALVGCNGAGKTSLLRAVAGSLPTVAGTVRVAGQPVAAWSRRELARRVAVVPQDTEIPFPFTVAELVLMGRAPHQSWLGLDGREDLERARAAMERAGVSHLAARSVLELSGGERQLTAFARALAQEPALLLLDEPTAFLDLRHRVRVMEVVRAVADDGGAALVVSHDLALASRAADRLVVLGQGGVLAEGAGREVLTAELLASAFGIEAEVLAAGDGGPVVVPRIRRPSPSAG